MTIDAKGELLFFNKIEEDQRNLGKKGCIL